MHAHTYPPTHMNTLTSASNTSYMHVHNTLPLSFFHPHKHTYTNVTFMCCKHQQSVTPTRTLWHANQTLKGHYSTMYTGVPRNGMKASRFVFPAQVICLARTLRAHLTFRAGEVGLITRKCLHGQEKLPVQSRILKRALHGWAKTEIGIVWSCNLGLNP